MTSNELRTKFLKFFQSKDHAIIPSASLIPENDPSVLFTTAGMHPLVPFLLGENHPSGRRLANCQKCVRTGDIDEVGDNCHLTFFEMLGNWSFGDYWKKEAINWSWEFLTGKKWLGLDSAKIAVSVFKGDQDCPFDEESYNLWKNIGLPENRIARLDKNENWWPAAGVSIGPQGPDTEIFYWAGQGKAPGEFNPEDKNWVEIWNDVFMEFERTKAGKYFQLKQKNVDTGMGLERTLAAIQGKNTVFETDLFKPLIDLVKSKAKNYDERSARIIVDHLRTAIFILADEHQIIPSNVGPGYVLRKLIRRAIRHAKEIEINIKDSTEPFVDLVVNQFKDVYPEVSNSRHRIINELNREKDAFEKTLEAGLREFNKFAGHKSITGEQAFNLYSTYGFPLEIIKELAAEKEIKVDEKGFELEFQKHQELSRTASVGMFKGGLVNQSAMAVKYHTATHLLLAALRQVLGGQVEQRGCNINDERIRFDFSYPDKMTAEQINKVEEIVNQKIREDLPVTMEEMGVEQAKKSGAMGIFTEKYGDKVKVYTINQFSKEICGGPHVQKTGELGHFKIIKEEASSKGVRRIKAVLE